MIGYHTPVLLEPSVNGLNIDPNGIYVDCTFGGGGHSAAILKQLKKGKLIAFDQDIDALANQPADNRLLLIQGNFRYLWNYLHYHKIDQVNGILADLGVSSHHFDVEDRGFSFRFDGELDMRMNQQARLTAKEVVNTWPVHELKRIFREYGEIDNVGKLVFQIEDYRKSKPIETIGEFKTLIEAATPQKAQSKYLAKVFQALRIEVNQEMEALKEMLLQSGEVLIKGGRLVVITYHSLEDRLVKNYIKNGMFEGEPEKDLFGRTTVPFSAVNRKVIVPDETELEINPRSRSAKLRIAERI